MVKKANLSFFYFTSPSNFFDTPKKILLTMDHKMCPTIKKNTNRTKNVKAKRLFPPGPKQHNTDKD